jgi:hypothetical protein
VALECGGGLLTGLCNLCSFVYRDACLFGDLGKGNSYTLFTLSLEVQIV